MTKSLLIEVCKDFGWGPNNEVPVFRREGEGWRLGYGIVTSLWRDKVVPEDPEIALREIVDYVNKYRGIRLLM